MTEDRYEREQAGFGQLLPESGNAIERSFATAFDQARMTAMADEATFVFANRTAVCWAEPTSERPSDATGE